MKARNALLSLALLASAVGIWWVLAQSPSGGGGDDGARSESARTAAADGADALVPTDRDGPDPDATRVAAETPPGPVVDAASGDEAPEASTDDEVVRITGRLLLPTGAPAPGAELLVHGWSGNEERRERHGLPEDWQDVEATTDADGRFELRFVPPRAFSFELDATLDGHVDLSWRWFELMPGAHEDVGEHRFAPAASIVGRVVDEEGQPTGVEWRVIATSAVQGQGEAKAAHRQNVVADLETGRFELNGLPEGPVELEGDCDAGASIEGPPVQARLGETTEVDLVYRGPELGNTITVISLCRPFHSFFEPVDGRIVATDAAGVEFEAVKVEGRTQLYRIDGLQPGNYTVAVESRIHSPWSRSGVRPGEVLRARLQGSARVSLAVVDAGTGEPVEGYRLRARLVDQPRRGGLTTLLEHDETPPPGGLFEGVIPGEVTLHVDAPGYADAEHPLEPLEPGSQRSAVVQLFRGGEIVATVQDSAGAPVAGAKVQLYPAVEGYAPASDRGFFVPHQLRTSVEMRSTFLETDADGRAVFERVGAGAHGLYTAHAGVEVTVEDVSVSEGGTEEVTLTLPAIRRLEGRLVGADDGIFEGMLAAARPVGAWDPSRSQVPSDATAVDADGRFVIEGLEAVEHHVVIGAKGQRVWMSSGRSTVGRSRAQSVGTVVIEPEGTTTATFDAGEWAPGSVRVEALLDGEPGRGLAVELRESGSWSRQGVMLDGDGRGTVQPILPGSYDARVWLPGDAWMYERAGVATVEAGDESEVRIEITTAPLAVLVQDPDTGEPVPNVSFHLRLNHVVTSDDEGRVVVNLVAGDGASALEPFLASLETRPTRRLWRDNDFTDEEVLLVVE